MEKFNVPTIHDEGVEGARSQCMRRASTMYLMLKEAQKAGAQGVEWAEKALWQYGVDRGQALRKRIKDPENMVEFGKVWGRGFDAKVFEMEIIQSDDQTHYVDFHYCPYVEEWQRMGLNQEEMEYMCKLAMIGDHAVGEQFKTIDFTLGKTIAQGHPVCQIRWDVHKD